MSTEYETQADVQGDGALSLTGLPFPAGTRVDVVVRPLDGPSDADPYPLRRIPLRYDAPFEAVAADEWQALRADP